MKRPLLYAIIGIGIAIALALALAYNLGINNQPQVPVDSEIQVLAGTRVELHAERVIGGDVDALIYHWTQLSGEHVTISNNTSSQPIFSIPPSELNRTLVFQVDTSDGKITTPSVIKVIVLANKAPSANAGKDIMIGKHQKVILDGSQSLDKENAPLMYKWLQTGGPKVELQSSNDANPSFLAPDSSTDNTLTFELVVNDGMLDSKPDTVKVTVKPNIQPIANAGQDQTVKKGKEVRLDGLGSSDPDDDKLTYKWNQTSGPTVELSDNTAANPTFLAPSLKVEKRLTFQLVTNDGILDSKPDSVSITVNANKAPAAEAGPDFSVESGNKVRLNATASSDPDDDKLTYKWNQTSGPTVELSDNTAVNPTFNITLEDVVPNVLTFKLVVNDGMYDSKPDYVRVKIVSGIPMANAGANQTVNGETEVILDGSKSSAPYGNKLTYKWTQTGGPTVNLSDETAEKPTFKAPAKGNTDKIMTFQLVVSGGTTNSKVDTVTVTVLANKSPKANAGPDQTFNAKDDVVLDGSKSSDPDGDKLTYEWKQISGISVFLKYATQDHAVFKAPSSNTKQVITFQLTVSDEISSMIDIIRITVKAK